MKPTSENSKRIAFRLAVCGAVVAAALAIPSVVRVANGSSNDRLASPAPARSDLGDAHAAPAPPSAQQAPDASGAGAIVSTRAIYDPAQPLLSQMDRLKALAGKGDPYATCVLGQALDSCVRHMDRGRGDDNPLGLDPEDTQLAGDARQVEDVSAVLGSYERTDRMCSGLGQGALQERDERLFRSAMMGHPRSMARFALNPVGMNSISLREIDRMVEYRKNAASMLDRAAIAGVPEAIRGVYRTYSSGAIVTTVGDVDVGRDLAKSVAAARVLLLFADEAEKEQIAKDAEAMMAGLAPRDRERAGELEAAYRSAYLAYRRHAGDGGAFSDVKELPPERICSGAAGSLAAGPAAPSPGA